MRFTINNKNYSLNIYWATVTLRQATDISNLEYEGEIIDNILINDSIEVGTKEFEYIVDVLSILSDCSKDILINTEPLYINVLFSYVQRLVNELYNLDIESYKPSGVASISFMGKTYSMPATLVIDNEPIIAYKEPAKNITEAANLMLYLNDMKHKGIGVMKYICALYLKETEGELYDDDKVKERAELFNELPMSIVWEVFFYTYFSLNSSMINTLVSLKRKRIPRIRLVKLKTSVILTGSIQWLKQVWQALYRSLKQCLSGS